MDLVVFQKRIPGGGCPKDLGGMLGTLSDGLLPFVFMCCHSEYLW